MRECAEDRRFHKIWAPRRAAFTQIIVMEELSRVDEQAFYMNFGPAASGSHPFVHGIVGLFSCGGGHCH